MEDYINDLLAKARELAIEGKLTEAKQLYRTIILDYPNSTESNIAIEEMKKLDSLDFSDQNCSTNSIKPKKKGFPTLQVISLSILLFGLFFSMPLGIVISLLFNISDSDILALIFVIVLLVSTIASLTLAILSIVFKKPRKVFSIVLIVISTFCFIFDFFLLCTGITDIASPKDNNVVLPTPSAVTKVLPTPTVTKPETTIPTQAPTSTPRSVQNTPEIKKQGGEINVVDLNPVIEDNYVYTTAAIVNNTNVSQQFIKVRVEYYSDSNYSQLITIDTIYACGDEWIAPGERKTFETMENILNNPDCYVTMYVCNSRNEYGTDITYN